MLLPVECPLNECWVPPPPLVPPPTWLVPPFPLWVTGKCIIHNTFFLHNKHGNFYSLTKLQNHRYIYFHFLTEMKFYLSTIINIFTGICFWNTNRTYLKTTLVASSFVYKTSHNIWKNTNYRRNSSCLIPIPHTLYLYRL